jgi:RNA polymerase sigma-70 factor, ECF subfamily
MDEKRLLAGFRRGESEAFQVLRERHAARLWQLARMRGATESEAEDLVQETFLAAYQGRERFRGNSTLSTYLTAILLRRQRDVARKHSENHTALSESLALPERGDTVESLRLREALGALEEHHRDVLLLVSVSGLTSKEAGAALGISDAAVRQRLMVATRLLRARLLDSAIEEENHVYTPA